MIGNRIILPVFVVTLAMMQPALGGELVSGAATIIRSNRLDEQIPGLSWKGKTVGWKETATGLANATVHGTFTKKDVILVLGEQTIAVDPKDGTFAIEISIRSSTTPVGLYAVDAFGKVEKEKLILVSSDWSKTLQKKPAASLQTPRAGHLSLGLGGSLVSFETSRGFSFSEKALTAKGAYAKQLTQKLSYAFTTYFTALPFGSSHVGTTVRFFGITGALGYSYGFGPWDLTVRAGYYFTTSFSNGLAVGYRNLSGPMLFPVLTRRLSANHTVAAYAKYSPIMSGFKLVSLSNRELAGGVSWTRALAAGRSFALTLDVSDFGLVVINGPGVVTRTITMGAAYGFSL